MLSKDESPEVEAPWLHRKYWLRVNQGSDPNGQ